MESHSINGMDIKIQLTPDEKDLADFFYGKEMKIVIEGDELKNFMNSHHKVVERSGGVTRVWDDYTYYREEDWPDGEWVVMNLGFDREQLKQDYKELQALVLNWWVDNGRDSKFQEHFKIQVNRDGNKSK